MPKKRKEDETPQDKTDYRFAVENNSKSNSKLSDLELQQFLEEAKKRSELNGIKLLDRVEGGFQWHDERIQIRFCASNGSNRTIMRLRQPDHDYYTEAEMQQNVQKLGALVQVFISMGCPLVYTSGFLVEADGVSRRRYHPYSKEGSVMPDKERAPREAAAKKYGDIALHNLVNQGLVTTKTDCLKVIALSGVATEKQWRMCDRKTGVYGGNAEIYLDLFLGMLDKLKSRVHEDEGFWYNRGLFWNSPHDIRLLVHATEYPDAKDNLNYGEPLRFHVNSVLGVCLIRPDGNIDIMDIFHQGVGLGRAMIIFLKAEGFDPFAADPCINDSFGFWKKMMSV